MTSTSAQAQFTGTQGFVNPKYVVVGVTYAPPGTNSNVSYENTISVGSTTNISQSFQSDIGYSVAVAYSLGQTIPAGGVTPTGGVTLTFTQSQDYTQGSNSSATDTISKSSTIKYTTNGTPTFAPVNDDYDYIWIWINPELLTAFSPAAGSVPAELEYQGFVFDPNDPVSGQPPPSGPYISGPDVVEVQVGCLNGDFQCPSTLAWANGVEGPGSYIDTGQLARSWASASAGYQWAAGRCLI
jgi:hypothetical protein